MNLKNEKGAVLVAVLVFFSVVFTGFSTVANLADSSLQADARAHKYSQALYLAEAASEAAKARLLDDFWTLPAQDENTTFALGAGEYYFTVSSMSDPDKLRVTGYGAIPNFTNPDQVRTVEIVVQGLQEGMFSEPAWAGDKIDLSESTVTGDLYAGNEVSCDTANCSEVSGDVIETGSSTSVPSLDMAALKAIAQSQSWGGHDNYYDEDDVDQRRQRQHEQGEHDS